MKESLRADESPRACYMIVPIPQAVSHPVSALSPFLSLFLLAFYLPGNLTQTLDKADFSTVIR